MTERPIPFSAEMVRAILAERKTQTRRVIKPQPWVDNMGNARWKDRNFGQSANHVPHIKALASPIPCSDTKRVLCPYGKPGDLLWVREAWRAPSQYDDWPPSRIPPSVEVQYIADDRAPWISRYRSPRFMPRWASRITLRITDVRVERLQDIREDDARAEGCDPVIHEDGAIDCGTRKTTFARLWNRINGPGAWDANPWVWVINFERVKP